VAFGTLALLTVVATACSSSPSPESQHIQTPQRAITTLPPATTTPSTSSPSTSTPVAPSVGPTSPPASITADCTQDVSGALHTWFKSLPAGATVTIHPGSCYLVNEGVKLKNPQGLTVSGGEFKITTVPQDVRGKSERDRGNAVFWLVGGTHVTFESMQIVGANQGGYHPHLAFEAGIRSDGVDGLTVSNVTVTNVFGDGIELNVLRGAQDDSGRIIRPSENVTMTHVTVNGAGWTGVALAGASGVSMSDIHLSHIGINDFDLKADQWNEGAKNVTINGCSADGAGGAFFSNGGAGDGQFTSNINVENCTMSKMQGGDAIYEAAVKKSTSPKGPITFVNDHLICGHSAYVACVDVTGGNVTISQSSLIVPPGYDKERMYSARRNSTIVFDDDTAEGYGKAGRADKTSTVSVTAGTWEPVK
jgi:Right handed beta helix region